jgi:site-specific recombinase XerD
MNNLSSPSLGPELAKASSATSVFDAWLASSSGPIRGLSEDTESVQRAMWNAFEIWCGKHKIAVATLTGSDLHAYLQSREGLVPASELTPRYAWRLVTLVDRICNHLASVQGRGANHAAAALLESLPDIKHANAESLEPVPQALTKAQDRMLVEYLESYVPNDPKALLQLQSKIAWQDLRNHVGVALQRGAGLTPLEIRTLTVDAVFIDQDPLKGPWKVRAPATGSSPAHDAPLARWARPLLTYWLQCRREMNIAGDWLLPSTKTGKPWGKTAHFEAVSSVFESAGMLGLKGGSYRLRHTFALRQLARADITEAKVAAWMGVAVKEMQRYRGLLMEPVEVI